MSSDESREEESEFKGASVFLRSLRFLRILRVEGDFSTASELFVVKLRTMLINFFLWSLEIEDSFNASLSLDLADSVKYLIMESYFKLAMAKKN